MPPLVGEHAKDTPHILREQENSKKNYANVISNESCQNPARNPPNDDLIHRRE